MPNWSKSELLNYEQRRNKAGGKASSPNPEPVVQHALARQGEGVQEDAGRFAVGITSFRTRLADEDALVPKYILDALRYSGLLPSDTAGSLDYKVRQIKVAHESDARTEIEITPL